MEESKLFQGEFTQTGKLWKRTIAYIADGFVLLLPTLVVLFVYFFIISGGNFSSLPQIFENESIKKIIPLQIILWFIILSYFTYFIGKTGQTPGKKIMGVKVVDVEGNIIGYKKAFVRSLFYILYGLENIGFLVLIISAIIGRTDKYRRMLHDRACKTFVISKEVEEAIEKIRQEGKPRLAGASIFALILSIVAFVVPVIGQIICFYVCGRVLYDIKQSNGLLRGKSLAMAGLIISVVYLIAFAVLFLFIIPATSPVPK